MGDDLTEFLSREKVYNRKDAHDIMRTGILANTMTCPDHLYSGLYAIETHIPTEIREPYYTRDSVDACASLLAILPCSLNTNSDMLFFTNAYLAVMHTCGLKAVNP